MFLQDGKRRKLGFMLLARLYPNVMPDDILAGSQSTVTGNCTPGECYAVDMAGNGLSALDRAQTQADGELKTAQAARYVSGIGNNAAANDLLLRAKAQTSDGLIV